MSILGGVEKIHNNLNTYTTEDIKVFKFSTNEWEAIINDDDYSLLQPIRDWRALGKTPIIEIPAGVFGMSGGRSISFAYLPLTVVGQSSEYTVFAFQTAVETVMVAAYMTCQGTNVINFDTHTTNLPIISGNTVDGELLTIDGAELKTSGISVSDLEDLHDDVNTKTFYLSGTSDLTNAQAAYDWYLAGKNPIIFYNETTYILAGTTGKEFISTSPTSSTESSTGTKDRLRLITLTVSGSTVTAITASYKDITGPYLKTNYNYSYTPQYNGSPATKKYVDDSVSGAISAGTTAPSNPTEGQIWYDTTNDVVKVYDGTNWNEVGKEYNAGKGISIGDVTINGRQGPSPDGFHVPSKYEWEAIYNILTSTFLLDGNRDTVQTYLKLPFAGYRSRVTGNFNSSEGAYWSYSPSATDGNSINFDFGINYLHWQTMERRATGLPIRAFKDISISPDNNWTTLYDGSSVASGAGIFWNSTDGLISVSGDGTTWYTIMDKNLGATTVYNSGDTLTDANCGYFYQRGNNYGFPHSGTVTTSSTKVDASSYGPTNPYSSDTFIIGNDDDWSSVHNDDLWGYTTGTYTLNNAISNTGVLSVNGQTGDVVIDEGNTKTFYISSTSDLTNAQAALDWHKAGKNPIIVYDNKEYILSSVASNALTFTCTKYTIGDGSTASGLTQTNTYIFFSGDTVSSVTNTASQTNKLLATGVDYSTPYTPEYNGSPATKKYVDDNAGIPNDTTGTTSTIGGEWVGTKAEFNALSSYGNKIYNIIE